MKPSFDVCQMMDCQKKKKIINFQKNIFDMETEFKKEKCDNWSVYRLVFSCTCYIRQTANFVLRMSN